jgi:hypothetical protein
MAETKTIIEQAYSAFNKRDIDGALALMTQDVSWPKASEGCPGQNVVFISVFDAEPYVRAANLPFIPYCEKEFPLGSVRQRNRSAEQAVGAGRTG